MRKIFYNILFLSFCDADCCINQVHDSALVRRDSSGRTFEQIRQNPQLRCIKIFLQNFYSRFWAFVYDDDVDDKMPFLYSMMASLSNDVAQNALEKCRFYQEKAQISGDITDFFRQSDIFQKSTDYVRCGVRHFYYTFIDAFTECFFDNNAGWLEEYVKDNFTFSQANNLLIKINGYHYFKMMEEYRYFEIMLEMVYEYYFQADRFLKSAIRPEDAAKSFFLLLPVNAKSIEIFQKLGCSDTIQQSVLAMNECDFSLNELKTHIVKICLFCFKLERLLPSIRHMGLSTNAKKGIFIADHELNLSGYSSDAFQLADVSENPNLPIVDFVKK
jgi:hypothetical protein